MTKILNDENGIALAAQLIKNGEIVAFPTETVYGLGANALDACAVAKIFEAKGRPSDNPLIVHIDSTDKLSDIADGDLTLARELFREFSPGPLTLVLPKNKNIPDTVTAGLKTVGVRIPAHPMALAFLKECGLPIAAPSANSSGRPSPTTAQHVLSDLEGRIEIILDGGPCDVGIESTVLDLTAEMPTILRPGAITEHRLLKMLKTVHKSGDFIGAPKAPGMKHKHYAPEVPLVIAENSEDAVLKYRQNTEAGKKTIILNLGDSPEEASRNLFAKLREAEKEYDIIIISKLPDEGIWASVMNRLYKAAEGK